MNAGTQIVKENKLLLRLGATLNSICYALGIALFVYPFTLTIISIIIFVVSLLALLILIKPWHIDHSTVTGIMNKRFDELEYSTELLIRDKSNLNLIESLQSDRLSKVLEKKSDFRLSISIWNSVIFMLAMVVLGNLLNLAFKEAAYRSDVHNKDKINNVAEAIIGKDTVTLEAVSIDVIPPKYTGQSTRNYKLENLEVLEGSTVSWTISTSGNVDSVVLEIPGQGNFNMNRSDGDFVKILKLSSSGFYSINLYSNDSIALSSNLYAINIINDETPKVEIKNQSAQVELGIEDEKVISLNLSASDDYGLTDAYIIVTVTKGSGESVKFREERLEVMDRSLGKQLSTNKIIDLKALNMSMGDELYFYLEAIDNKPEPQASRTDTYFVSIRDTTEVSFSIAGSLGVDIMPTYFRSQRQIIIDTKKLLKQKPELSKAEFNSTSNGLAHDQKTLRLKYGQFMGLEDESGIAIEVEIPDEAGEDGELLDEYSHDHDGDNEHNLVEDDHDHEHEHDHDEGENTEQSPLESYMHNHDNPEEATLYTQSTRSMLKEALSYMWDSELYLRLNQPEKSLPYQYKSLELIKKIKNQARIYVHRIGFDPPPIKMDKRLTGEIEDVESRYVTENFTPDEELVVLNEAISILSEANVNNDLNKQKLKTVLQSVTEIIASKAVMQPIQYLETLELLKKVTNNNKVLSQGDIDFLINKLYKTLPPSTSVSSTNTVSSDSLSQLFLNRISNN